MDLSIFKEKSIIICPNEKKKELLKLFSKDLSFNLKFVTKENVVNSLTYSFDDKAVLYLQDKGYSFSNALEILENLKFITAGSNKLNKLLQIKEELNEKNLLVYNPHFINLFKGKKTYIYGYSTLDKELSLVLEKNNVEHVYIEEDLKDYSHTVLIYENLEDEVSSFFNGVCSLIEQGISIDDIYLFNYPSEYDLILRKYSKVYGLPINFSSNMNLSESPIFKEYISLLCNDNFEDAFNKISEKQDDYGVLNKIVSLLNDIYSLNLVKEKLIELLINKASKVQLHEHKYLHGINIVSSSYRGEGHIFVLGFSLGSYPIIKKDTDFLSDKEKIICSLNTSKELNNIAYEQMKYFLLNNKNLHISFKEKMGKQVYYQSLLIEDFKFKTGKPEMNNIRYSKKLANLEVASYRDLKIAYGLDNKYIDAVNITEQRYLQYDHRFKSFEDAKQNGNINISYSQIDDYSQCPFKYYIKRICGGKNAFEDTFYTKLGRLFHTVFEDSLVKEVSKENYLEQIDKEFVTPKEQFFINKLFDQVLKVVSKNRAFKEISSFKKDYGEQKLYYVIDEKSSLNGVVDKIMINDVDKEIIVVDYKTGNASFKKDYVEFGLSLQLPLYSLLISKTYPEYSITGVYIQNVLSQEQDENKLYRLDGITINDEAKINRLEHSIDKSSKYIAGLNKTSKGFKKNSSLIEQEEFDKIVSLSEEIVENTVKNIRDGKFPIRPIYVNNKNLACDYCPLKSVCFKDEKDNYYVETKE